MAASAFFNFLMLLGGNGGMTHGNTVVSFCGIGDENGGGFCTPTPFFSFLLNKIKPKIFCQRQGFETFAAKLGHSNPIATATMEVDAAPPPVRKKPGAHS